jgi:hypothetical protein
MDASFSRLALQAIRERVKGGDNCGSNVFGTKAS